MSKMPEDKAKKMQAMLNKLIKPKPPLEEDGKVGPKTEDAIKLLQKYSKLSPTGKIDGETAIIIVRGLKTGKLDKDPPKKYLRLPNGTYVGFTDKEYDKMRKKLIKDLKRGPVTEMKLLVSILKTEWEHFDELNSDQWFVSFCIEVTRGANLPSKAIITSAEKYVAKMEKLADAGNFKAFATEAPKAARYINGAVGTMRTYRESMIDGGGNWVTGLEITKFGSFTLLSVVGAPMAGAALGAGALSTAVVGGAALKATETAAGEIGTWSAGSQSWTVGGAVKRTLVDGGIGAITGYLAKGAAGGKHFADAGAAKLAKILIAKNPAFKKLSEKAVLSFCVYLFREGGKSTLSGVLKDVGKLAKDNKSITFDSFLDNVAKNFAKGVALGPVSKVVEKYSAGKSMPLDRKDIAILEKNALKQVMKNLNGKTIHIDAVKSQVSATVAKQLDGMVTGLIKAPAGKILDEVIGSWTGPLSATAIDKKVKEKLITQKVIDDLSKLVAIEAEKKVKKLNPA